MTRDQTRDVEQTITVHLAGELQYSHRVPADVGEAVLMADGYHNGTCVLRREHDFLFVELDGYQPPQSAQACSLVRLSRCNAEKLSEPCAYDLDTPDGLALIGHEAGADLREYGEVLWRSDDDQ
jgi:hypothetical protein